MNHEYDRFTAELRGALRSAQGLAVDRDHAMITSGHIVEILLSDKDVVEFLAHQGLSPAFPLSQVQKLNALCVIDESNPGFELSKKAKEAIERMVRIGKDEHAYRYTTVHLLRGIREVDQIIEQVVFNGTQEVGDNK